MKQHRDNPDFEAFLEEVRKKLPAYLQKHEVEVDDKGWFRCISPNHEDRTPSCHFVQAEDLKHPTRFKCFGCGAAGDIFTAASFLEGKPTEGKSWQIDNVFYLADLFEIAHAKIELTEEEILVIKQQRLYNDAAEALVTLCEQNPAFYANAESRGIWRQTCKTFGVGSVPWVSMLSSLTACGWEESFIRRSGIDETHFHERFLTFTLKNMNGSVVGFDRRYMDYDPEKHKAFRAAGKRYPPKYMSTDETKCRLMHKNVLLLNIHWAKQRPLCRLDVFEGFLDFYTAFQAGHQCCTAVCGSNFTEYMVGVIRQCGFSHVNLVYDSDQTGLSKMAEAVEKFRNQEGLHLTIMPLNFTPDVPESNRDVDFYLKAWPTLEEGLRYFMAHKPISAFEWILDRKLKEGATGKVLADQMIGLIVNEINLMDRGALCKQLAERVGIPETDIRAEVDRIANQKLDEITRTTAYRIDKARNTSQRVEALRAGLMQIDSYEAATKDRSTDPKESVDFIRSTIEKFQTTERGILGWKTGWRLLDQNVPGIPKSKGFIVVGGAPNTGKTALLHNIGTQVLLHNEEPTVCFFSLDDPRESTTARLLALITGLPINWCQHPMEHVFDREDLTVRYRDGCAQLMDWAESGRIVLKGSDAGGTVAQIERVVRATQDKLSRPVLAIVDSFHNIAGSGEKDRFHYRDLSKWCHKITDTMDFTLICTAEGTKETMRKPRPNYHELGETAAIGYDAQMIGMVHNDVHFQGASPLVWQDYGTPRPIIETHVQKNKICTWKGIWYFKFRDTTGQVFEVPQSEMPEMTRLAAAASKQWASKFNRDFRGGRPAYGAGPQDIFGAP